MLRIRIRNMFFPDLGSRILNSYFWELTDNYLSKKFYNPLKIGLNFFLQQFKNKIIFNYVKLVATKKDVTATFFHPSFLLLFLDPGSGMGKNQDPGSGINIPEPQHCLWYLVTFLDQSPSHWFLVPLWLASFCRLAYRCSVHSHMEKYTQIRTSTFSISLYSHT